MSMARSLLGLNSDTEDEAWYPDEEYTEDSEYDHDLEDAENHASDDTWDVDELEVDGGSDASGAPDGPEFGKPSDFYPSVIEPVQDGVNLERSGSYGKPPNHYLAAKKRLQDHSSNTFDILTANEISPHRFDKSLLASAPAQNCQWTITDATLSPDNNWLAYSSITPYVHLVKTRGEDAVLGLGLEEHEQEVLRLSSDGRSGGFGRGMGIWSLRFDSQGRELVAGCTQGEWLLFGKINQGESLHMTWKVCFADKSDPSILASGSDDSYIKVWDRRCLKNAKPAGVLIGHTEGITYVSSKGDGRYIVSNGKDQAAKLWDLRNMVSGADFEAMERPKTFIHDWDYRHGIYARPRYLKHPQDSAVMTYRGHSVLYTLIRVHFSPPNTTGQRYIGSGSADGNIHVWNLDGTTAQKIERSRACPLLKPSGVAEEGGQHEFNDPYRPAEAMGTGRTSAAGSDLFRRGFYVEDVEPTVRDISWNPNEPSIMSTSWGSCSGDPGALSIHPFLPHGRINS
ncbi:hypothetical protein VP01_694g11 [Puccinia sorghi]|uniref:Uncharacterized protein n=1 Tax=Puccinia sorghi TaxID=27349 RepID=A0A0L6UE52_9BASI|nr:hypothetical protein VP01_694g11 [Puccinia sorghi]